MRRTSRTRAFWSVVVLAAVPAGCSSGTGDSSGRNDSTVPRSTSQTADTTAVTDPPAQTYGIQVTEVGGGYDAATGPTSGVFHTGQAADLALSSCGIDTTCGPAPFDKPGQIASDGTHLALADTRNNRVLLWNTIPTSDRPADLVLGQPSMTSMKVTDGLDGMNEPIGVTFAGGRLVVADTSHWRLLVWNQWPTSNGQPADYEITGGEYGNGLLSSPYSIWSDGTKLVVAGRTAGKVLVWNTFPTSNRGPDFTLDPDGRIGTPRYVASDGVHLVVGDYDSPTDGHGANFFWDSFPTADTPPDFVTTKSFDRENPDKVAPGPMVVMFLPDGKMIGLHDTQLLIWNTYPTSGDRFADVVVGAEGPSREFVFRSGAGIGDGLAYANGRLFISEMNANAVAVYDSLPTDRNQRPDWMLGGAASWDANPRVERGLLSNPVPASDGTSLWVVDDLDNAMAVWTSIPATDGAPPDYVYQFPHKDEGVTGTVALYGDMLVVAGGDRVWIWDQLPRHGELPDRVLQGHLGTVAFGGENDPSGIRGITGLTLADDGLTVVLGGQGVIHHWNGGIPQDGDDPDYTLQVVDAYTVSSDGTYLLVTIRRPAPGMRGAPVAVYRIADLAASGAATVPWFTTNGNANPNDNSAFLSSQGAITVGQQLIIADIAFNRVLIWTDINTAAAGAPADIILGANSFDEAIHPFQFWRVSSTAMINPRKLWWDGTYLWIGEFKFSDRLLRFSPSP